MYKSFSFFIFILIILIIIFLIKFKGYSYESFLNDSPKIIFVENNNIYDNFYCKIYEQIIPSHIRPRIIFEVDDLINNTEILKFQKVDLLDIGCGTGCHFDELFNHPDIIYNMVNYNFTGIDKSESMLKIANDKIINNKKVKDNEVQFLKNDVHNKDLFSKSAFSHIVCYYFTLYSLNIYKIALNINHWLRVGGYFVIHVCDRDLFNPILDASNPFIGINLNKISKNRHTESNIVFDNMTYIVDYKFPKNTTKVYLKEEFNIKSKNIIRKQTQVLDVISINKIVNILKKQNIIHTYTTPLDKIGYNNQYILYFKKI